MPPLQLSPMATAVDMATTTVTTALVTNNGGDGGGNGSGNGSGIDNGDSGDGDSGNKEVEATVMAVGANNNQLKAAAD